MKDVTTLAREAGFESIPECVWVENTDVTEMLERFAALVCAAALEEAEAECEKRLHFGEYGARSCRDAIRQLKEKT